MITLLQHYTLSETFMFIVILAVAIKQLVSFAEWVYKKVNRLFNKQHNELSEKEKLERRLQKGNETMDNLKASQNQTDKTLEDIIAKIDMLIDSDKDSIKAYITQKHHQFCYDKGWIDDFSLDCLEKRYQHYEDEGGNSFIEHFMEELRALPKQEPPQ